LSQRPAGAFVSCPVLGSGRVKPTHRRPNAARRVGIRREAWLGISAFADFIFRNYFPKMPTRRRGYFFTLRDSGGASICSRCNADAA
jgi:hypothetical protein